MTPFEVAHDAFIRYHLARRIGERRGRLERGHRHAESLFLSNIWWILRGNFDNLHPEYEVLDWRGRSYFADFAWLPGYVKLLIEIKGFATHVREMDRHKYSNELNRETFLTALGYQVISFSYDDVEQRPELCITLLRMVLSKFVPGPAPVSRALLAEKELLRLAMQSGQVRPLDVELHFDVDHRTAVSLLQKCCTLGWLIPIERGASQRIVRYELAHGALNGL